MLVCMACFIWEGGEEERKMFQLSYPIDFVRPAKKDYVQWV